MQKKKNAIKLSIVLEDKRLNKKLKYIYVCSKKVENKLYI
jgi:hypothetical protein